MTPDSLAQLRLSHAVLARLDVPHGLIGGWAVIAWGRIRATKDLDWLAAIPASRRKEVLAGLASLGTPEWRPPGEDDPISGLIRITPASIEESVIDILIADKAADRIALSRCVQVELGEDSLPAVRPEDIIAMKLQSGGGIDIDDVRGLLESQAGKLDEAVLEGACKARRVTRLLEKIRRV